ncbi:GTP pyrophosphokinase [Ralstonia nicotianae]
MTPDQLRAEYAARHETILKPLADRLVAQLQDGLSGVEHIDRVAARAKSLDRFLEKALKARKDGGTKYDRPFEQIQDLVGARIIVFYKQDVDVVSQVIERYYRHIECRNLIPESESEFGYVGKHLILAFPEDLFDDDADRERSPIFFELQIKTLFQHAWSEAGHDLAYKPDVPLSRPQKRLIAFTAAQAWGADQQFAQLHCELNGAPASNPC